MKRNFLILSIVVLITMAGNPLLAQPQNHGVAPWQAERLIKEFVNNFVSQQVLTNDYSKVRVKIADVRRVYNKDLGWIVVARFEGAIVPDVYSDKQIQQYVHGVLRISADKNGVVHGPVVNEDQGLWKGTARTADLHRELSKSVGGWKDWGGNPADLPPAPKDPGKKDENQIGGATPYSDKPVTGIPSVKTGDSVSRLPPPPVQPNKSAIMKEYTEAKKDYEDLRKDPQKHQTDYKEIEKRFYKANEAYMKLMK